jgi:hypothetical protein
MDDLDFTREPMDVIGSVGVPIDVLLKVRADALLLARRDASGSHAASLPVALIDSVDVAIRLNAPARAIFAMLAGRPSAPQEIARHGLHHRTSPS